MLVFQKYENMPLALYLPLIPIQRSIIQLHLTKKEIDTQTQKYTVDEKLGELK